MKDILYGANPSCSSMMYSFLMTPPPSALPPSPPRRRPCVALSQAAGRWNSDCPVDYLALAQRAALKAEQVYIRRESADALHCRLRESGGAMYCSSSWPASSAGVGHPPPQPGVGVPAERGPLVLERAASALRPSALRRDWAGRAPRRRVRSACGC